MSRAAAPAPARLYRSAGYTAEESVGYLMRRVMASIVHQADARLVEHGLTSSQWGPLLHLHKAGRSTVAELARCTQVDAGAMTRLLDRLEAKQLCTRQRCTEDRRVVLVDITPKGAAAITEVPAVLSEVLNAHLAGFSKAEWESLKDYLRRMADNGEALRHPV
jgi:DNA-binding MarR family transcriptional regulator